MKKYLLLIALIAFTQLSAQNCAPFYAAKLKQLSIDSLQLAYIDQGKGETIVFIHGLGGNAGHWTNNIDALSKKYRCIAIDLPAYGASSKHWPEKNASRLDDYADLIIRFTQQLKLKQFVLAGHSMGGQIAMITALKAPALVSKLILAAPAGFETFTETEKNLLLAYATPQFYFNQNDDAIKASFAKNFVQVPSTAQALINDRIQLKQCAGFMDYCQQITAGVKGMLTHPVQTELSSITQPTLIVFGKEDALIPNKLLHPKATTESIAAIGTAIPKQQTVFLQAGHLVQFEQADAFNQNVLTFLDTKQSLSTKTK